MVWKINNNCQIFIEKTDSIAGRQKEIIPHVSAYYVDKYKNESAAFFNLAHSGPYVVLAISDRPVGVDIEHTKRMSYKVAKRIMRKEQLDRLEGFENESDAFQIEITKYWTQYEAIMKLVGTGFSGELDDKTMEAYEKRVVFRELEDYVIAVVIK